MIFIQLSLFGKTSWERFLQMTGWTLEPSYPLSQTPKFQCLLREDGQTPEWCEGDAPISHGGSWTPNTGQGPGWPDDSASFLWQTLEGGVLPQYCLSPAQCSHFLRLAQRAAVFVSPRSWNVSGSWACRRGGRSTGPMAGRSARPSGTRPWATPSPCPVRSISWRGSRRPCAKTARASGQSVQRWPGWKGSEQNSLCECSQ